MLPELSRIKGLHPGAILRRELKIKGLKSSELANSIDEHKQTISAILNKRRDINPKLSIKLSKEFEVEEDYFMLLQASYDVKKVRIDAQENTPELKKIRKELFWDTIFESIDWKKNKRAVIQRILERGNDTEIKEIISFYGKEAVITEVKKIKNSFLPALAINIEKYELG